mmetsp:Transcript_4675/g.13087  ORF Transcript_4675/g.13087 Transcript_4675/m.13087 type:complete len:101 (+) Transcript_4675:2614-2916(+)
MMNSMFAGMMNYDQFSDCPSLHTIELPGPIPRNLWPLLLEIFLQPDRQRGFLAKAGIWKPENRVSIAFNFFRANITLFFLEPRATAGRKGTMAHKSLARR